MEHAKQQDALLAKESVGTIHSRADLDHDDEDAAGPIQTQVFLALYKIVFGGVKIMLDGIRRRRIE